MDTPVPVAPQPPEEDLKLLEAGDSADKPERLRTPRPEALEKFDRFWAGITPEERAFLEEQNRLDKLDYDRDKMHCRER
jgi:hypothetical protein